MKPGSSIRSFPSPFLHILLSLSQDELEEIKSSVQNQKIEIPPVDLKPIQQVVEKGISDISFFLLTQE